jgi:hypothetical protein
MKNYKFVIRLIWFLFAWVSVLTFFVVVVYGDISAIRSLLLAIVVSWATVLALFEIALKDE